MPRADVHESGVTAAFVRAQTGSEPMSSTSFGKRLSGRGLEAGKCGGDRVRLGLKLRTVSDANKCVEKQRSMFGKHVGGTTPPCVDAGDQ